MVWTHNRNVSHCKLRNSGMRSRTPGTNMKGSFSFEQNNSTFFTPLTWFFTSICCFFAKCIWKWNLSIWIYFKDKTCHTSEIITLYIPENYKSISRKEIPIIRYIFTVLNITPEKQSSNWSMLVTLKRILTDRREYCIEETSGCITETPVCTTGTKVCNWEASFCIEET